jgi:hypothetical protein
MIRLKTFVLRPSKSEVANFFLKLGKAGQCHVQREGQMFA